MAIKFLSTVQVDTDVLYVDTSNDRVGIGTPTPTTGKLVVSSSANQLALDTGTAGDGRLNIGHFSNGTFIGTYGDDGGGADLIRFGTHSGDERMRITSGGDVGIGTTSPSAKLDVIGVGRILMPNDPLTGAVTAKILSYSTAPYGMVFRSYSSGTNSIQVQRENNNSQTFALSLQPNNGNVGIGTTNPVTKLQISGTNSSTSATALFSIQKNEEGYGLFSGILSSGTSWLQSSTKTESTHYSLALQPNGGNVGIGTTSPNYELTIGGGSINSMQILSSSTGSGATDGLRFWNTGGSVAMWNYDNTPTLFGTNNAERMRIDSGGNVLIGNTTAGAKLDVRADTGYAFRTENASGYTFRIEASSGNIYTTGDLYVEDNNKIRLGASGDLQIYHDGADSYLDNDTGHLYIRNKGNDKDVYFQNDDGAGGLANYFYLDGGGAITRVSKNFRTDDSIKLQAGSSGDLNIFHNGTNSYIENDTGDLYIRSNFQDRDIIFQSDNGGGGIATYIQIDGSTGAVQLNHYGSKKFETKSYGVEITGQLVSTDNIQVGNNLILGDNKKAFFGGSNDLQIYHNGSNSYINDTGTGDLYIQASDNMYFQTYGSGKRWITLTENAGVDLFHNDAHKLSTGAVSVGIATTTGGTLIDGWKTTTQANAINDTTIATTAYVNNKIGLIPAGLVFQGTWNAATNTPTLTSGSGTTGNFYIVSVAGSTNLDGITDWKVGDWAVFIEQGASDQWEKIDNSSVLDGFGTGQSVTKWDGSGTSNTLTDGPITFSGNNSTFAGAVGVGVSGGSNAKLEVVATSGEVFRADSNNGAYRLVVDQTGANIQGTLDVLGQVDIKTGNDLRLYRSDNATYARFNYAGGSVGLDIDDLNGDGINLQQAGVNKLRIETSGNATFAGTINSDNITVGKGDGNNSFISLTANTGNWTFTNVQASRNLEISDSDGTGVALTIDTNANATFAGNIALGDGKVVKWGNGNQQILGNNTSGLALYSNGERMRILTNGNVGIGTTNPAQDFVVADTTNGNGIELVPGTTATIQTYNRGTSSYNNLNLDVARLLVRSFDYTTINTGSALTERMRWLADGQFWIKLNSTTSGREAAMSNDNDKLRIFGSRHGGTGKYVSIWPDGANENAQFHSNKTLFFENVGIGTTSPNGKLQFSNDAETRKIVLWEGYNNDYQFYGFGIESSTLVYTTYGAGDDHVFFVGTSGTSRNELMRIKSTGSVIVGEATVAAANAAADNIVIKGEGAAVGLTISNSVNSGTGTIFFGDAASSTVAGFRYNHNTGDMAISAEDNVTFACDRVGIGTTNPGRQLELRGEGVVRLNGISGGDPGIDFQTSDVNDMQIRYRATTDVLAIYSYGTSSDVVNIKKSSGNVGIGVTPRTVGNYRVLDISGGTGAGGYIGLSSGSTQQGELYSHSGGVDLVTLGAKNTRFYNNGSERMRIDSSGNVGIGTTSPNYKLSVSGGIQAGGVVTYSKVASSLDTTGFAIAGLGTAFNGSSAGFTFTAYGGTGKYQKVVYSCYGSGTTWYVKKVIDEGTNTFDIVESASSAATITFTFKTRSGSQGYSPRVVIEATGHSIISTYA